MNTLDSRYLSAGDCFGQKFPVAGEVRYFLSAGRELVPGADQRLEGGYVIHVKPAESGSGSKQHNVHVMRRGHSLEPTPAQLEIHAGDGVLWFTTDPTVSGFHVSGAGKDFQFSSSSIRNDAIYTHVFGVPGKYEWRDPNGSGIHGCVEVANAIHRSTEERSQWYETLKKPATFEIKDGKASPESVKIVVGQTVFWSINHSRGIAITDGSLLASSS